MATDEALGVPGRPVNLSTSDFADASADEVLAFIDSECGALAEHGGEQRGH